MKRPLVTTNVGLGAAIYLLVLTTGLFAQPSGPAPTSLRDAIIAAQQAYGLPAIGAAVTTADKLLDVNAAGVGRLDAPIPVLQTDRFHLGSLTKAMTATLIATLVEEGLLEWGTPVVEVIPTLAATANRDMLPVTVEQVLQHRAGLDPYAELEDFDALPNWAGSAVERRLSFTRYLWERSSDEVPGQFTYSNAGYAVAAAVAEQLTGTPWEELMRSRLFEPLGMEAGFDWPALADPAQPWGHWMVDGRLTPHPPDSDYHLPDLARPAGDVHASLEDYVLFLQLHLRGLQGRESFLSPETFAELHRPNGTYALGWNVALVDGAPVSTHFGSAGTFFALAVVDPVRNLGIIVVTNSGHPDARTAMEWTANAIADIWAGSPETLR